MSDGAIIMLTVLVVYGFMVARADFEDMRRGQR